MLNIVIPMAGRGSRFAAAGYQIPKPMIPVYGVPMIEVVLRNITPARECRHIFLVLREHLDQFELEAYLQSISPGCAVVPVEQVTGGAACTVLMARNHIENDQPLMIANSDQFVDLDINAYLDRLDDDSLEGLIMTFWSDHPKWSYCRLSAGGSVTEVVEKQVVSNEATVGIYNFRQGRDFVRAAERMIALNKRVNGEFYAAPAYNELIAEGRRIGVFNIGREYQQMYGLGVPEDLRAFESSESYRPLIESWREQLRRRFAAEAESRVQS
jgi:dTDP-glucose pyrophosphorylase